MILLILLFIMKILNYFIRKPNVILHKPDGEIYLRRWWLIPRNRFGFNIFLHHFLSSDEDRALHDHPWWNISILLSGSYLEYMPENVDEWIQNKNRKQIVKKRYPLIPIYRNINSIHKIELINNKPIWTIFITGPVVREWGFMCPTFWRHNKEFNDKTATGSVKGKGCD
jgi:hypothetical protein